MMVVNNRGDFSETKASGSRTLDLVDQNQRLVLVLIHTPMAAADHQNNVGSASCPGNRTLCPSGVKVLLLVLESFRPRLLEIRFLFFT